MNNFQTILVASFLAFFVFGVLIFSGILKIGKSGGSNPIIGKIIIWGTLPASEVAVLFENISKANDTFSVDYIEKKSDTYQSELIDSFANDTSPDLFILNPDMVLKNDNFIYKIPYANFSEKAYRNLFIDGADIFIAKDGIIGYPMLVDPLVLYYNKNMLSNQSILYPPKTWDELFDFGEKLTKKQNNGLITESMIALGQYDNVNHSKDILSMLLLQGGNKIVEKTDVGYRLTIKDNTVTGGSPFEAVVNFFLEFSNPSNQSYTWNRSLPNSFDMFTSGKLAFYIGYASELFKIQSVNPNLSFDVTMIPQTKGTDIKRTYGQMNVLVLSKKSKNIQSSYNIASLISAPEFLEELGIAVSLPTTSRSLLNTKPESPYLLTFTDSAIITHSWLDPDRDSTDSIFRELIENSLSNKLSVGEAINKAYNQIELILKKNYE